MNRPDCCYPVSSHVTPRILPFCASASVPRPEWRRRDLLIEHSVSRFVNAQNSRLSDACNSSGDGTAGAIACSRGETPNVPGPVGDRPRLYSGCFRVVVVRDHARACSHQAQSDPLAKRLSGRQSLSIARILDQPHFGGPLELLTSSLRHDQLKHRYCAMHRFHHLSGLHCPLACDASRVTSLSSQTNMSSSVMNAGFAQK